LVQEQGFRIDWDAAVAPAGAGPRP